MGWSKAWSPELHTGFAHGWQGTSIRAMFCSLTHTGRKADQEKSGWLEPALWWDASTVSYTILTLQNTHFPWSFWELPVCMDFKITLHQNKLIFKTHCPLTSLKIYLLIWKADYREKGGTQREWDLPSAGSFSRWLQWPGLSHGEAGSSIQVSHFGRSTQILVPSSTFPRPLYRKLDQ